MFADLPEDFSCVAIDLGRFVAGQRREPLVERRQIRLTVLDQDEDGIVSGISSARRAMFSG